MKGLGFYQWKPLWDTAVQVFGEEDRRSIQWRDFETSVYEPNEPGSFVHESPSEVHGWEGTVFQALIWDFHSDLY